LARLAVEGVSVRFGGLLALDEVGLEVEPGVVTGLIGPNGAGKTTLFNVVTGLQPPDGGRVSIDGVDLTGLAPHRRARLGVARTFQRLEVFGTLSVSDNVLVAAELTRRWTGERRPPAAVAADAVARVGLSAVADQPVDDLPTGSARLVEVARALAAEPRVLLLDEPSSGLDEGETAALGSLLEDLAGAGLAVLLVEHDMALVMATCQCIHVLDFGRVIARGTPAEVQADPRVRAAYLGDTPAASVRRTRRLPTSSTHRTEEGEPVLALRGVRAGYGGIDVLDGVDLAVAAGTVFALLGPNGAGKSTTLKVAGGRLVPTAGDVLLCGRRVNGAPADGLARAGLCTIPEGRGVFPNLTVAEHLRMATYAGGATAAAVEARAFERFPRLRDRRQQLAGTLSGGEQQMLAMARALVTDPALLLLDELSMGLAPMVVEELYELVGRIAAEGVSILVVEQFAHEVLGVADRAAIMVGGRVARVGSPTEVSAELAATYLGGSS
jgi:branched-chain amino acid transport system ATP-binding protein